MVILVFFLVISVNRRLFRYFGSYSGISVIPVILVNRRTASQVPYRLRYAARHQRGDNLKSVKARALIFLCDTS